MYHINSALEKPNTQYLGSLIEKSCTKGIRLKEYDLTPLKQELELLELQLYGMGLRNPNSINEVNKWVVIHGEDLLSKYRKVKGKLQILNALYSQRDSKGYVYPSIQYTKTNRVGYINPAILTIPKEILWDVVDAREDGRLVYSVDVKTQEPLILLNMYNVDLLNELDEMDLYSLLFYKVHKVKPTKEERKQVKTLINALNYGASTHNATQGIPMLEDIARFYKKECKFQEFNRYCNKLASAKVTRVKNYFGTIIDVGNTTATNKNTILNILIQSVGADIMSYLCMNMERVCGDRVEIYFSRNDELILDVKEDFKGLDELLQQTFSHKVDHWRPFDVDIKKILT